jgi:septal ring factor EnvC (AmiA/AmiB activator)
MIAEPQIVFNELSYKIRQLMSVCERMKNERYMLQTNVTERDAQIADLNRQLKELEEKNKKLQLARAFETSGTDTRDAKLKIGRIVREIDKCMALLNK